MSDTSTTAAWTPTGSLTIEAAALVKEELLARVSVQSPFTVDLSRIERLDTACLQLLLAAKQSGLCTVTGVPDTIKTRLTQVGCYDLLMK
ncbi:MAG: STAS domain-containing protein [Nitrospiraceae bacterium]